MVASLLLLLKGPMQSWGDESRYNTRATAATPSKSGIVGLIAAAQGRRRTDPVEDLAALRLAVRVDQPGNLLRDYQTAQQWLTHPDKAASLITRYYLSDAAFVATVESPSRQLLEGIADALRRPAFPLYLGRRSCPAPVNLVLGIEDTDAVTALQHQTTWYATQAHKQERGKHVSLPIYRDALPGEPGAVQRQDVPISFSQQHRQYGWRGVVLSDYVSVDNSQWGHEDGIMEAVLGA